MKKLILLLPAFALAQNAYLPTLTDGFCRVLGASSATPIVITVASTAACNLANGDTIVVVDVNGNQAANSHVKVAGETKHLARKVANLTATTFELLDMTDAPVAHSGTYTTGGRVRKAVSYPVQTSMGILLDGPTGAKTTALTATGATDRKNAANPAYNALVTATNAYNGTSWYWGKDRTQEVYATAINQALRWHIDGTATSRTQMMEALRNPDQAYATVSCTQSADNCGLPNSGISDYARQYVAYLAQACSIGCGELTSTERNNLWEYMYRDFPWSSGGVDYTASTWTIAPWKLGYVGTSYTEDYTKGSITVSSGSNVINGSGTQFVTNGVVAGDIVFVPHPKQNGYAQPCKVASLTETAITCTSTLSAVANCGGAGLPCYYAVGHGWDPGGSYMASEMQAKHMIYTFRCGDCAAYGTPKNPTDYTDNLTIVEHLGAIAKGLAGCAYNDQRGCLIVTRTAEMFVDEILRPYMVVNGDGINGSNASYNNWRVNSAILEVIAMLRYGVQSGPNYATALHDDGIRHALNLYLPVLENYLTWGAGYTFSYSVNMLREGYQSIYLLDNSSTASKEFEWFLNQKFGLDTTKANINSGDYVWWQYILRDPAIAEQSPRTTLVTSSGYADCVTWFGSAPCSITQAHGERRALLARSGWNATDTIVAADASAWSQLEHVTERVPGHVRVVKNGKGLLVNDGNAWFGPTTASRSIPVLGGDGNVDSYVPSVRREVLRPQAYSGESFTWQRAVLTPLYDANVTTVERQTFYAKPGGGVLVHDYLLAGTSTSLEARFHLGLNGAGTATSPTYAAVNTGAKTFSNNITGSAGLTGKAFALGGGTIALTTENSPPNLGYTGSQGESGRFKVCNSSDGSTCANGTSAEWVTVMETNGGSGSLPTIVSPTVVGSHRIVEVQSASPWVVAFTRAGACSTSLSLTTAFSGTGKYGVTGICAGTYTATVGGTPVSGSPFTVTDSERTITFDAAAGAVVVAASGGGGSAAGHAVRGGRPRGGVIR